MAMNHFVEANAISDSANFQLYLWGVVLWICFANEPFNLARQPMKNQRIDKNDLFVRGLLKNSVKNVCQNVYDFSNFKSMEILNCHSNQSN